MKLIIKNRKALALAEELEDYAQKKFGHYVELLEEPAVLEVVFHDLRSNRGGRDKMVALTLTVPHDPNPMHIEETTEDWRSSIDGGEKRLAELIRRWHLKHNIGTRFPKKYWVARVMHETLGLPKKIWGKFRGRG